MFTCALRCSVVFAFCAKLWERIRKRQISGHYFRRQHPLGHFIVDFLCAQKGLIVELDGGVHEDPVQQQDDRAREGALRRAGFEVLRFHNREVIDDIESVIACIARKLAGHEALSTSGGKGE